MAHRHERVHGLAGLGDSHHERLLVDDRVAVAELVRELHLRRDAAPVLDGVAGHLARVGGGAAGHDDDLVDGAQRRLVDTQLVQRQRTALIEAAVERIAHCRGLVVDLLFHEGVVAALLRGGDIPLHAEGLALCLLPVEGGDLVIVRSQGNDLAVINLDCVAGELDEAGNVGAEEVTALTQADDQRGVQTRGDDAVRVVLLDGQQRERALEAVGGQLHCLGEVAVCLVVVDVQQQGGRHLGVRVGDEGVALGLQLVTQGGEVLDDAVVHHREATAAHHVRVRVRIGRPTVGGPAGVADTEVGGRQRSLFNLRFQVGHLACLLAAFNGVLPHHRNTSRVVAAVLQTAQAFNDDAQRVVLTRRRVTYISNDSTHTDNDTRDRCFPRLRARLMGPNWTRPPLPLRLRRPGAP